MARGRKRIAFVGGTEKGKSSRIEEMVTHRCDQFEEPLIILDPNNQIRWYHYPEITLEKFETWKSTSKGRYRIITHEFERFFQIAFDRFKNGQIVAEEASMFCTPQMNKAIYNPMIALRHIDHNVDISYVFHSMKRVPDYMREQLNEIILFKTGDVWDNVAGKFPEHIRDEAEEKFNEIANSDNQYIWKRIILQKTGTK